MNTRTLVALAASAALLLGNTRALAQPMCGANGNPVVYITGTAKPFISALARALYADTQPITIVWKGAVSCNGLNAILLGTPISGTASYFDPASPSPGNEEPCTIPVPDGGTVFADIGSSDVFAPTCGNLPGGLPTDVGDFTGPVQSMTFVVPKASTQKSISATAAYFVYGFGAAGNVMPWTDDTFILRRNELSGTSQLVATGIGVPAIKWKGTDALTSTNLITKVTSSPAPEKTLGVLAATDITDTLSLQLNVLAYKHYGQTCGYYPDSSPSSKDKINTRDGHYALWGPFHFFAKIAGGNIPNENVRRVINSLIGTIRPPGGLDLIQVQALLNLVPSCAMKVKRTNEVGPLTPFAPPNACGCYYEQVATGKNSCKACTMNKECPTASPICSYGFCEAQ